MKSLRPGSEYSKIFTFYSFNVVFMNRINYYFIRLVTGKSMVLDDGRLTINWVAATKG
jgi:hypothetical protein